MTYIYHVTSDLPFDLSFRSSGSKRSKCSSLLAWKCLGLVMWLASILFLYTLTMLTIAHADRSRSTLKDDERFRNGLVCDLKEKLKMNQIISIQSQTISIQSQTISHKNSCINISMNSTMKCISNCLNTKNIEDKRTGKYYA